MTPSMPNKMTLTLYTISHFCVDALSMFFLFNLAENEIFADPVQSAVYLLTYNVFAFGLQWVAGLIADRHPRLPVAFGGLILLSLALLFGVVNLLDHLTVWLAVVLLGCGNAFFHVQGGRDSFVNGDGTETRIGLFAMGGAAGVIVGVTAASWLDIGSLPFYLIWLVLALAVGYLSLAPATSVAHKKKPQSPPRQLAPAAKVPLLVMMTLFLFIQTIYIPTYAEIRDLLSQNTPSFSAISVALALFAVLLISRGVGGYITRRSRIVTMICFIGAMFAGLIAGFYRSLVLSFILAVLYGLPTGYVGLQYYRLKPQKPAFAYALQKIPMFVATVFMTSLFLIPFSFLRIAIGIFFTLMSCVGIIVSYLVLKDLPDRQDHQSLYTDHSVVDQ